MLARQAPYEDYLALMQSAPDCCDQVMPRERWHFVSRNAQSDARADLRRITQPILAISGDKDHNVDYAESAQVISASTNGPCGTTIVTIPNADHALLPATEGRITHNDAAMVWRIIKIDFMGEKAFAPGSLSTISNWLAQRNGVAEPCWAD